MTHPLTIPFRAARFGLHLLRNGHTSVIAHECESWWANLAAWPRWSWRKYPLPDAIPGFHLWTEHPVSDGPDTKHPWGAVNNWKTSKAFVLWAADNIQPHLNYLDLGCSTGALVRDFHRWGANACGLEGCDYPSRYGLGSWPQLEGRALFKCDIGRPFKILSRTNPDQVEQFHLITAWAVLEHLDCDRLVTLMQNIRLHSMPGTRLIVVTDNTSEKPDGVELHLSRWAYEQWFAFFKEHLPEFVPADPLPRRLMLRWSNRGLNFFYRRTH